MIRYENLNNLKSWIERVTGRSLFDFELENYIKELEYQQGCTGSNCYELSSFETVSKNPECFYYDYEAVYDDDGDLIEAVYIF